MNRKMYWGVAVLIIILIAAGGFIYWQWSEVQQLKEQLAQDNKLLEGNDKPVAENNLPPAKTGKKWVPHGDHFHEVPIDAPDVWQGGAPEPIVNSDTQHSELSLKQQLMKKKNELTQQLEVVKKDSAIRKAALKASADLLAQFEQFAKDNDDVNYMRPHIWKTLSQSEREAFLQRLKQYDQDLFVFCESALSTLQSNPKLLEMVKERQPIITYFLKNPPSMYKIYGGNNK